MKKQGGFTLIELVVVIVILGILAVTAAPKFLNLQDDAKVSAVKGLAGAMKGAAGIVYGKAAVAGVDTAQDDAVSSADGTTVEIAYGYPKATSAGIGQAVDGLDTDWVNNPNAGGTNTWGYKDFDCYVVYTQATGVSNPASVTISGAAANCDFNTDN
ncbi:type II secretion system protein [Vibrio sp. CK2-1]|uniref:type II secretion system protein n=1 Tax=Vibrio sp. CK2-1 TaxID=2912249 RepID=UPI001F3542AA|nr:type II secretion system protein [Vibrio sp. CK2-1]MCF7353828.1 type II secretion system GspH family protein [Vibrio sp. CK2-1]